MAKLSRELQKIFAIDAQSSQVTAFRTAGGVPTYTKDVSLIQNTNFTNGWLDEDNSGNVIPYVEDMNGLFYTLSRNIAYLNQVGIPEWINSETYYENALCMYNGVLYISLQDNNTNRQPDTQTTYWTPYASPVGGSVTGGENTGTGTGVYTSTSSGTMSFKTLVGGGDVTIAPSQDGDSVVISCTGGGGGGSVAWGNITGSLSSQTDLATALSQRGTLSGTNTWTGSNSFGTILPSSNTATLGNSSNYWEAIFTPYITADEYVSFIYEDARIENSRFKIGFNGVNLGLFPEMNATDGYDSYLGDSTYRWDELYSKNGSFSGSVAINTISSLATLVSPYDYQGNQSRIALSYNPPVLGGSPTQWGWLGYLNSTDIGIFPSVDKTCKLGSDSFRWSSINVRSVHIGTGGATYGNDGTENGLAMRSYDETADTQRMIFFHESAFIPAATKVVDLGGVNARWKDFYSDSINVSGSCSLFSTTISATSLEPTSDSTVSLGSTSNSFKTLFIKPDSISTPMIRLGSSGQLQLFLNYDSSRSPAYALYPPNHNVVALGTSSIKWSKVYSQGGVDTSDRDQKDNIEPLEDCLEKLIKLPIYSFTWKNTDPDYVAYGTIAQEALKIAPELVEVPKGYKEGDGTLGMYTNNVLFLAVKAIQELSAKVENLENKIKTMEVSCR